MSGPPLVLARALEVEAEVGQALRRPVGEDDLVARQEPVARRVVDQVDVRVQARVAAVAGLRVHVVAGGRQRVGARGAGRRCGESRRRGGSRQAILRAR